jgi:hypothetical protein
LVQRVGRLGTEPNRLCGIPLLVCDDVGYILFVPDGAADVLRLDCRPLRTPPSPKFLDSEVIFTAEYEAPDTRGAQSAPGIGPRWLSGA